MFPRYTSELDHLVGDLDPQVSKFTLVPLKVAYKKLRLLVDLGCIFIGHGLAKDFRTISQCPFIMAGIEFSHVRCRYLCSA